MAKPKSETTGFTCSKCHSATFVLELAVSVKGKSLLNPTNQLRCTKCGQVVALDNLKES